MKNPSGFIVTDVKALAKLWDAMDWKQRFWETWTALVVMEGKYENAQAEADRLKVEIGSLRRENTVIKHKLSLTPQSRAERYEKAVVMRSEGVSFPKIAIECDLSVAQARAVTRAS